MGTLSSCLFEAFMGTIILFHFFAVIGSLKNAGV